MVANGQTHEVAFSTIFYAEHRWGDDNFLNASCADTTPQQS